MTIADRSAALTPRPPATESVAVPEWGDGMEVMVKRMSGGERIAFERAVNQNTPATEALVLLWILAVVDSKGHNMFTKDDAEQLRALDGTVLQRIGLAALRVNGLREQDIQAAVGN